jgi:BirA family biotin operon repressor/biotin-[acetyl-CoA-carboxylase] ligase
MNSQNDYEPLDAARILAELPLTAMPVSLHIAQDTGSTQDDALAAPAPAQGCAVFLAERQSAGRGRRGREWVSPPGANIYFSLSRRFARPLPSLAGLSLAVGVALAEGLRSLGFGQVRLKWPNDLWIDARKLGGILVQLRPEVGGGTGAVIGIGLNVRMPIEAGQAIDQPWCDLSEFSATPVSRNAVVAAMLAALLPALDEFEAQGLAHFLWRWQGLDALRGQHVQVQDGDRLISGLCQGVSGEGALRLECDDGSEVLVHGGEASLRPASKAPA